MFVGCGVGEDAVPHYLQCGVLQAAVDRELRVGPVHWRQRGDVREALR